jgi:hypothetical protein
MVKPIQKEAVTASFELLFGNVVQHILNVVFGKTVSSRFGYHFLYALLYALVIAGGADKWNNSSNRPFPISIMN